MRAELRLSLLVGAALTWGACTCGAPTTENDGGVEDAGALDGGQRDASVMDAGIDAGELDAGSFEDAGADGGTFDAGSGDGGALDAGADDAGIDGGGDDAGTVEDAGIADAGLFDAGVVLTCTSCHGNAANAAPPRDTHDVTLRTARTVGAHQEHLSAESWRRLITCEDCHRVPATIDEPGHLDPSPAELTFGPVANAGNVSSSFNGNTCTTYCHGVTLSGGDLLDPDWMTGPNIGCGRCHGNPPPAPHPAVQPFQCATCHEDIFQQGTKHIDGTLDITLGCTSCHGSNGSPAPPQDTNGGTSTALRGVGAHRSHLGTSRWHAEVTCDDCHTVPTRVDDPGHIGLLPAEVHFGASAQANGAQPTWNGTTCSTYCHGQTLDGGNGSNITPAWTTVNGTQAACGTCHGLPPAAPHPQVANCSQCHGAVIGADGGFVNAALHIDGQVEAQVGCGSCHALPPPTGTHLLHVGANGSRQYGNLSTAASTGSTTGYAFGCGQCHPLDSARHLSGGRADIELYSPSAPPGSLKARAPLASYTAGATTFTDDAGLPYSLGTCSTYCHSGPAVTTPNPVPRPGIDFTFAGYPVSYPAFAIDVARQFQPVTWGGSALGCSGCHGSPIRSAEPGNHGAGQSHSWVDGQGRESGHGFNHGDAPLGCRVCHHDTVTAANSTTRISGLSSYGAVPIVGFAAHVNGLPDVAFDTSGSVSSAGRALSLAGASYSQTTHTCSNVACHKAQNAVPNGHPFRPDQVNVECNVCHQY